MIKLVQNELIKIFKRKSIYFLLFLSVIVITLYNKINPDQNQISSFARSTKDIPVESMERALENITDNMEEYVIQKVSIDSCKLYNIFEENSWQRYALKEERTGKTIGNVYIDSYLHNINDYEFNPNSEITSNVYETSKMKYNEYLKILTSDNWKDFLKLRIQNLEEKKKMEKLLDNEIEEINFEIEFSKLRLNNNINFDHNLQNQYLEEYKNNYFMVQLYKSYPYNESQTFINKNMNEYKSRMNICKYAIENNIKYDISNEKNLIYENKIDARISFIRTFEHFDLLIVIIVIYIATTIVTEETNKRTIKNLLAKPHKRSTILISKILACTITLILAIIFITISQYIIGGILWGFDSYQLKYVGYDYSNQQILIMNLFNYIVLVGLSKLPMYMMIITFCIFIGIINNHTSMSMILTLIIFLISITILAEWSKVEVLSLITRFFIITNWDFSTYLFGQVSDISGVTIYGSIVIYLIHLLILLYLSIHYFNKKEIHNI